MLIVDLQAVDKLLRIHKNEEEQGGQILRKKGSRIRKVVCFPPSGIAIGKPDSVMLIRSQMKIGFPDCSLSNVLVAYSLSCLSKMSGLPQLRRYY